MNIIELNIGGADLCRTAPEAARPRVWGYCTAWYARLFFGFRW